MRPVPTTEYIHEAITPVSYSNLAQSIPVSVMERIIDKINKKK